MMLVKRILILAAAGIASIITNAVLAGGISVGEPDETYLPTIPPAPAFQPFVYFEANGGYADVNWKEFNPEVNPFDISHHISSGTGGFTGGIATGYQFMRHFAGEFGFQWLPVVEGPSIFNGSNLQLESWFLYLAGKLIVPLMNNFDLYGLLGLGFRSLDAKGPRRDSNYWNVFFGAGIMYHFNRNWFMNGQYMIFPSDHSIRNSGNAPMANLYTAGVGYDFAL